MKNKRKLLCLFLCLCILLLCLCGCVGQRDITDGANPAGSTVHGSEKWELVTPSTGLFFSTYTGNEQGAYLTENDGKDSSGYITYFDYATMQHIYLSPQLDVTFDEQNPGWIDDIGAGHIAIATEDALYVYIIGVSGEESATYEAHPARLLKMKPNGADREEIVFSGNYDVQLGSAVATDGEELYFLATRFQFKTGIIEATVLLKSDFDNKEMVEVCEIDGDTDTMIIGTCDDGLVLQKSTGDMKYGFSVLTATGEEKPLSFTWKVGETSRIVYDNKLIVCDAETGEVTALDILTGETEALLDLSGHFDLSNEEVFILRDVFDNHLILGVFESLGGGMVGKSVKRISADIVTKEIKDFTLFMDIEVDPRVTNPINKFVEIEFETENDFFVIYGEHHEDVIAYAPGGSEYIDNVPVLDLALIDKDDYWNSVPNFRTFADET